MGRAGGEMSPRSVSLNSQEGAGAGGGTPDALAGAPRPAALSLGLRAAVGKEQGSEI